MIANHNDTFSHIGFISKISDSTITVNIEQNAHCESCKAKSSCGMSESTTKEVEILNPQGNFKINEEVEVILKKTLGLKAVVWAYLVPFILMFVTLLIGSEFASELSAGLLSIAILIPYYTLLYLLKNKLKNAFQISILKHS